MPGAHRLGPGHHRAQLPELERLAVPCPPGAGGRRPARATRAGWRRRRPAARASRARAGRPRRGCRRARLTDVLRPGEDPLPAPVLRDARGSRRHALVRVRAPARRGRPRGLHAIRGPRRRAAPRGSAWTASTSSRCAPATRTTWTPRRSPTAAGSAGFVRFALAATRAARARRASRRDLRHLPSADDGAAGDRGLPAPPRAVRVRGPRPVAGGADPDGRAHATRSASARRGRSSASSTAARRTWWRCRPGCATG